MHGNCFSDAAEQKTIYSAPAVRANYNQVRSPSFGVFDNTASGMALNDRRRCVKAARGESSGGTLHQCLCRFRGSLDERRHSNKVARFNHAEKVHYSVLRPWPRRHFIYGLVRSD
jgi:hypothetical protein